MPYRFKQLRGSFAQWDSSNPVLLQGEMGYEESPVVGVPPRCKVGDGSTPWKSLPYWERRAPQGYRDLREFAGSNNDEKLAAALLAIKSQASGQREGLYIPPGTTLTAQDGGAHDIDFGGLKITSSWGESDEFSDRINVVAPAGNNAGKTLALFNRPVNITDLELTHTGWSGALNVHLFKPETDFGTSPIVYWSIFDGCSFNGFETVFHGRVNDLRMTGRTFVNNAKRTPFKIAGADIYLFTDGGMFDTGPNITAGEYGLWLVNCGKTTVGPVFGTGSTATWLRIDGGTIHFTRLISEAAGTRPTAGAGLWQAGGNVTADAAWFKSTMANPSATGRGDQGVVHMTGGTLTMDSPVFGESDGSETYNHFYVGSGATLVLQGLPRTRGFDSGLYTRRLKFAGGGKVVVQVDLGVVTTASALDSLANPAAIDALFSNPLLPFDGVRATVVHAEGIHDIRRVAGFWRVLGGVDAPPPLVSASFTGADGTLLSAYTDDSSRTWASTGNATIQGNVARLVSGASSTIATVDSGVAATATQTITATAVAGTSAGIAFWYLDSSNYYFFNNSNGQLYKVESGGVTSLATAAAGNGSPGDVIGLTVSGGNRVVVTRNGTQILDQSVAHAGFARGTRVGIRCFGQTQDFDNFTVQIP